MNKNKDIRFNSGFPFTDEALDAEVVFDTTDVPKLRLGPATESTQGVLITRPKDSFMTHCLKTWPEQFQAVVEGRKTAEMREDDRGYQVGDELLLREWLPPGPGFCGKPDNCLGCLSYALVTGQPAPGYTNRFVRVVVTHLTRGGAAPVDKTLRAGAVLLSFVVTEVRA